VGDRPLFSPARRPGGEHFKNTQSRAHARRAFKSSSHYSTLFGIREMVLSAFAAQLHGARYVVCVACLCRSARETCPCHSMKCRYEFFRSRRAAGRCCPLQWTSGGPRRHEAMVPVPVPSPPPSPPGISAKIAPDSLDADSEASPAAVKPTVSVRGSAPVTHLVRVLGWPRRGTRVLLRDRRERGGCRAAQGENGPAAPAVCGPPCTAPLQPLLRAARRPHRALLRPRHRGRYPREAIVLAAVPQ
jgi:hypothetical protein